MFTRRHIDDMTCKWLNLGQNPPRIPEFHTLKSVKISHHNKILGDLKRLHLEENFFNDKDKHYRETLGIAIGTKKW